MPATPPSVSADRPDLLRGALAGLAAGLVASFLMDLAQKPLASLRSSSSADEEPATEQAADAISTATGNGSVSKPDKALAGQAVHYVFGGLLGLGYGVAAELWPHSTAGFGAAFGLGTSLAFDEAAVPAAGFGPKPWETPARDHLYGFASHLVYGLAAEGTRRTVRSVL